MNVLVGQFITESNAGVPHKNDITDYDIAFGDEAIRKMQIRDVFENEGITIIPSIYANAGASGLIKKNTFDYIESSIINVIREHLNEIDGIYLMLHGASEVEGLGSGDHHILKSIREVVGDYMPIAVACDPHGNLSHAYVEQTTIIRSYRESPHTDQEETWRKVAKMLCDLLKNREHITPAYRKLPMILGGEQSVSLDEPVKSINQYLDALETDERILSCSWHVGYIRHDTDVAGCGVIVVPKTAKDQSYAEKKVNELAEYVWERRNEFHYTGLTATPEDAFDMALKCIDKVAVITDSGDNMTSGAPGWNTYILRQALHTEHLSKSILFAPICDPMAYAELSKLKDGTMQHIKLGIAYDELSKSVELDVTVKAHGEICEFINGSVDKVGSDCVLVSVAGVPIDIIVSNKSSSITSTAQLSHMGIDWTSYDITILKLGYIFPDFKERADFYVMSLTEGVTLQNTAVLPFKRIMRPMFPIDRI